MTEGINNFNFNNTEQNTSLPGLLPTSSISDFFPDIPNNAPGSGSLSTTNNYGIPTENYGIDPTPPPRSLIPSSSKYNHLPPNSNSYTSNMGFNLSTQSTGYPLNQSSSSQPSQLPQQPIQSFASTSSSVCPGKSFFFNFIDILLFFSCKFKIRGLY